MRYCCGIGAGNWDVVVIEQIVLRNAALFYGVLEGARDAVRGRDGAVDEFGIVGADCRQLLFEDRLCISVEMHELQMQTELGMVDQPKPALADVADPRAE